MKLAVNVRLLLPAQAGGLEVAFREILHRILAAHAEAEVTLVTSHRNHHSFADWAGRVALHQVDDESHEARLRQVLPAFDVLWCPMFFLEPVPPPVPAVVTIPDLQHEVWPEFFGPELLAMRMRLCRAGAGLSARVLTLSEFSRRHLIEAFHLPDDHVTVVHLDCADGFRAPRDPAALAAVRKRHGLSGRYLLFPANAWAHKNHGTAFAALARYRARWGDPPPLVLTGARGVGVDLDRLARDAGVARGVRHLGYVPAADLPALYDGADMLVFPSLFEGFGIPVVEAMRRGTPVVASNTTSIPEIAGDSALLVDPRDPDALATAIHDVLTDPAGARARAERGRQAVERFSYARAAEETWLALSDAARAGRGARVAVAAEARPKVFVVTPSFNQARFLRQTIDSVLGQDYPGLEYFVADGGSTDGSVAILESYGDRVRWVSKPDGGQAAAIAAAWRSTDAEIVAWLNSDDTYLPGAVSAAVEALRRRPDVAMVYGRGFYVDAEGRRTGPYPTRAFDAEALAGDCFICQPTAFLRREVFRVIGLPDASLRYCMDYDLWIRLSRYFSAALLDEDLATSRMYAENKTLGERDGVYREILQVTRRHYGTVHPTWALGHAYYRWERAAARFSFLPGPARRPLLAFLSAWQQRGMAGPPHADGWAGGRTIVAVTPGADGRVAIRCDSPYWPYRRPLRIVASMGGARLAEVIVRERGPFVIDLVPPEAGAERGTVEIVLNASRTYVPFRYGLSEDRRALSFRIIDVAETGGTRRSETAAATA